MINFNYRTTVINKNKSNNHSHTNMSDDSKYKDEGTGTEEENDESAIVTPLGQIQLKQNIHARDMLDTPSQNIRDESSAAF